MEFYKYKSYYKSLEERFIGDSLEWINNLPRSEKSEHKYSQMLLHKAYEQAEKDKNSLIEQHKQNIDLSIDTDKKWVSYILEQLLSNALKYTPEMGHIKLSMEEGEDEYTLILEDNGIGIPKEDIKRVFDRGFTGSTGRNTRSSTGMGLYLAKSLASKLGLRISVQSEPEKGSIFVVHFPKWDNY